MDRDCVDWFFIRAENSVVRTYYVTVEYTYLWQSRNVLSMPDVWEIYDWQLTVPATVWVEHNGDDTTATSHSLSQCELNTLVLSPEETADLQEFLGSLGCPSNLVYSSWDE